MQSSQSFSQLSLRQQLMLQAQQNLISPSASDFESRRPRMLVNDQNMALLKDGQSNSVGDLIPNNRSPAQVCSSVLPHPDSDMYLKVSPRQFHLWLIWINFSTTLNVFHQKLLPLDCPKVFIL